MTVLDEDGRLFGHWNIIDVIVIFSLAALVIAGYTVVTPIGATPSSSTAQVTFKSTVSDATASHLTSGLEGDHVTITHVGDRKPVSVITDGGTVQTRTRVTFAAALPISIKNGETVTRYYWEDGGRSRVTIGGELTLDFGIIVIDATITKIDEASR